MRSGNAAVFAADGRPDCRQIQLRPGETMFDGRLRSHHDAERELKKLLGLPAGRHPGGWPGARAAAAMLGFGKKSAPGGAVPVGAWPGLEARLHEKPAGKKAALYIHVPYCDSICHFCNLNRKELQGVNLDDYACGIVSQIKGWGAFPYMREQELESVYFGGGTPTVFDAEHFSKILGALKDSFRLAKDCEVSVESTLHNIDAGKVAAMEAAGVNRLSLGVQTFSQRGREMLGRVSPNTQEKLAELRKCFGGILSVDIIYSYPGQTLEELRQDAAACASLGIDGISFYSLMIAAKSTLAGAIERGEIDFARDIAFDMERHNIFYNSMKSAGFDLLELTKLVRPGADRYRYISFQYGAGDVIPVGSGAGGKIAGFSAYSMKGRLMVAAPQPRYEKYNRVLGHLQFGSYDPSQFAGMLDAPEAAAATETIHSLADAGFLKMQNGGHAWELTACGVFWGNNIAVKMLEAAISANGSNGGL
ncbi:MAG: radical SAM protein [Spirochaetes bacterium]|nr:radical SAM protein [Spirochaetota bacterium]